ncbi:hypothetical protein [uncultured Vibrio sp.]|uniref:hypothetical protein n=1 Tax=uncultured Vibrio sp. TaxID=114054 RepID=UPI0026149C85|nr:hypothetical protein [uncultured Vibrio sp.]
MKMSKSAIALAISTSFLFGCDFDIGSENQPTTPPPPPPTNPDADTITLLNERIRALPALDDEDYDADNIGTVTVFATGEYNNGIVVIDRPVNLLGEDGAIIDSSCTLVQRYETNSDGSSAHDPDTNPLTKIKNVNIENITFTGAAEEACSINESGTTARTAIYLAGDTGGQINFTNLNFEPNADDKAPQHTWLYTRGQFELTGSSFSKLDSLSGILVNAGSAAARKGSLIHNNTFELLDGFSSSEPTAGIQIGHKTVNDAGYELDLTHKDGKNAALAAVQVYNNTFSGFDYNIEDSFPNDSYNLAVFANDAQDPEFEVGTKPTNIISDQAIDDSGLKVEYNAFN